MDREIQRSTDPGKHAPEHESTRTDPPTDPRLHQTDKISDAIDEDKADKGVTMREPEMPQWVHPNFEKVEVALLIESNQLRSFAAYYEEQVLKLKKFV